MQKTPPVFFERHNYRKPWVLIPLIVVNFVLAFHIVFTLDQGVTGNNFVYLFLPLIGISLFFMSLEITTKIDHEGIHVRFFPFHWSYKLHKWTDIKKCYVRSSSPMREFGGWGWRYSLGGYGKAYTLYGFEGIQIDFKNDKKLFVGSRKAKESQAIINQVFTKNEKNE